MPGSLGEGKELTKEIIKEVLDQAEGRISVLDVGPGRGTYADLLADMHRVVMYGLEVWEPYIEQFDLRSKYKRVFVGDARDWASWDYDVVIFGDVLEHMTMQDAKRVFRLAYNQAGNVIVSLPIVHWPQGEEFGNPYEKHVQEHITLEQMFDNFPKPRYYEAFEHLAVFLY